MMTLTGTKTPTKSYTCDSKCQMCQKIRWCAELRRRIEAGTVLSRRAVSRNKEKVDEPNPSD